MKTEQVLELRKDISTPEMYERAGKRATKKEWIKRFPKAFSFGNNNEWFIDVTVPKKDKKLIPTERQIVEKEFARLGLKSISYKDAAVRCIEKFKKIKTK